MPEQRIGGGGDVGGRPGAVDQPADGQLSGVDADPQAVALAADRGEAAAMHCQAAGRGEPAAGNY